jgi:hypothetical protein
MACAVPFRKSAMVMKSRATRRRIHFSYRLRCLLLQLLTGADRAEIPIHTETEDISEAVGRLPLGNILAGLTYLILDI